MQRHSCQPMGVGIYPSTPILYCPCAAPQPLRPPSHCASLTHLKSNDARLDPNVTASPPSHVTPASSPQF